MKKLLFVLTILMCFVFIGCKDKNNETPVDPTPVDPTPVDPTPVDPTPVDEQPTITVEPANVEIYAGEEVELLFGVSATDAEDGTLTVIVSNDGGFDNETVGTYKITYKATSKTSQEVTAERTIVVNKPLSQLTLEVTKNLLGEAKWQGNTINFKHELYVELDADATLAKQSGVFHNKSDKDITVSVEGSYGVSAIIDANGVVISGRDGANSRLVNAENPTRAASTVTKFDEDTTISSAFAKDMVIPAGGYAIVIQTNYAGTTFDTDGRGFMNYNVIYQVGNVVKLYWADDKAEVTTYANQSPKVSGNTTIYVAIGASDDINALVIAGLTATDDNGTFELADDTKITEFTVVENGGYDVTKAGEYTFKLKCTDGVKETEFTRVVCVLPAEQCSTVKVGDASHIVLNTAIAIDQHLTSVGSYSYLVYTPNFALETDETLPANGYGVAMILNEYGEIVGIYDGANGRKFTAEHHTLKPTVDTDICTPATYLIDAYNEAKAGGYYLLVATNTTANNATGGSRKFLLDNRNYGATVAISGVDFAKREIKFTVSDKSFTAYAEEVVINKVITAGEAAKAKMMIYTKDSGIEAITCNGYGAAIVINKYGKLVRIYDAANNKFYDVDNVGGVAPSGWTTATYAADAYKALADGEILIIFPNDGTNADGSPRKFALSLRSATYINALCELTGYTFEEEVLTFAVGDKTFTVTGAQNYVINEVTNSAATKKMLIYTKDCGLESITCNGYGVAVVLDKYGILTKIYDGANNKYYDVDNVGGIAPSGWAAGTYAVDAYKALAEGETLVIFPHDGVNAEGSPRKFATSLRSANYINHIVSLTGFTFEDKSLVFENGDKKFSASYGEYVINEVTNNAAKLKMLVYTKTAEITAITCNGWGVAIVLDETGKLVRIYDGANNKFYDEANIDGIAPSGWAAGTYAVDAYNALVEGETLIIFPNDGNNADGSPRKFATSLRSANYIGKLSTLTGFTFVEEKVLKINDKTFTKDGAVTVAVNDGTATNNSHDFLVFTSDFAGTISMGNGYGEAFVIKDNKIVRIYDGANNKYWDADNAGVKDATKCTDALYLKQAIASLGENEWVLCAPHDGGSNIARGFLNSNKVIGATVEFTYAEVKVSTAKQAALVIDNVYFFGCTYAFNTNPTAANVDFLVYTYGYAGPVIKNGWCEAFVVDAATNKIVKIYDGVNSKYWDANGSTSIDGHYALATASQDAFAALEPGQYVIIGLNGGKESNRGRSFLVSNRKVGKVVSLVGATLPQVETTEQNIKAITVDGDRYFVKASDIIVDATGTAPFIIYNYGYSGELVKNSYGVALVVNKTTGKVTRVYDGASGKYWDADNNGVAGICTPNGYVTEAFNSLTADEYVIIAPNGATTGNVARGFLYGHRKVGIVVDIPGWDD